MFPMSRRQFSEPLSAVICRQFPILSIWLRRGLRGPNRLHLVTLKRPLSVVFSRLSCRLSASTSECLFGLFSFIFEDLSGLSVIILFVIHQVAHGGIGVPFRVGFSRLDLMFNYLRFYFRYRPISFLRFNMLLPLLLRSLFD